MQGTRTTAERPGTNVGTVRLQLEARRIAVDGAFDPAFDGRYSILVVLDGEGTLTVGGDVTPLRPWTRLFLPAAIDAARFDGRMTLARCLPPKPPRV